MSIFCLLWIPVFFFFRRSIAAAGSNGGYTWALLLGSASVIFHIFISPVVIQDGFGFLRWLSGFVDIISVPVFIPLLVFWLLTALRLIPSNSNYSDFALLWLIPPAAYYAVSWNTRGSFIMLVFVPLLWTALAAGMPFFINFILRKNLWPFRVSAVLGAIALPIIATTSWWAFFSQRTLLGFLLLCASLLPAIISIISDFIGNKSPQISAMRHEEGQGAMDN